MSSLLRFAGLLTDKEAEELLERVNAERKRTACRCCETIF